MPTNRRTSKLDLVSDLARRRLSRIGRQAGRRADRALHSFVNGLEWFLSDAEASVGRTPWRACLEQDKLTLRAYDPLPHGTDWGLGATTDSPREALPPVILVPPLMVKPYIFDLTEQRSLVQHL
ncbi:MAG TPA: hypothetical protein DCQ06_05920, partial [Myxococcales bacterium]|nr:hypothetical protein [Myxococcales bacterium]